MIQVLSRASTILGFLSTHRAASMQDITNAAGINFTTACNIVRTLTDLGWVRKEDGKYSIGPALISLAESDVRKNMLSLVANENARQLSQELNEGVVISTLHHGDKYNLVKISPDREIAINEKYYTQVSPYTTADGRLLLAYADDATRASVIERHGFPAESWNGIRSASALAAALAALKKEGISIRNTPESEICGIAVPIRDSDGGLWGVLGVFLPASRFALTEEKVTRAMTATAQRISDLISNHHQGAA